MTSEDKLFPFRIGERYYFLEKRLGNLTSMAIIAFSTLDEVWSGATEASDRLFPSETLEASQIYRRLVFMVGLLGAPNKSWAAAVTCPVSVI